MAHDPIPSGPAPSRRPRLAARLNGGLAVSLLALTFLFCDQNPLGSCPQNEPDCVPGLTIAVNTTALTLEEGESATVQITITRTGNFVGTVFLSVGGLPAGITFELSPSFIGPVSSRSALTLTNESAGPGTEALVYVHGRDGDDVLDVAANSPTITVSVPGAGEACAPWAAVANVPEGRPYRDIDFVDDNLGFVVGGNASSGPRVLRTLDGGRTWAHHTPPEPHAGSDLKFVSFASATVGFIYAEGFLGNQIFRTRDGGGSWELLEAYPGDSTRDLFFLNESVGFTLPINSNSILRTEDGGDTWARIEGAPIGHQFGIAAASELRVVIAGGSSGSGGLAYSDDGGLSWERSTAPNSEFRWVDFFDGANGVAGGLYTLSRTTDGGLTWQETATPAGTIHAGAARRCAGCTSPAYAVGQEIWGTTDGGGAWQAVCFTALLSEVEVLPNGSAVALGSDRILRRD